MQVLKFGGTSVASSQSMTQCSEIILSALERDRSIVVGSAVSGCTDTLIEIARLAAGRDDSYIEIIDALQKRHHRLIEELLPAEKQTESIDILDWEFESLRSIARGVYLLGELSDISLDAIQGSGELFSTRILATKLSSLGISTKWVDSRTIIRTHQQRGKNVVDIERTYANIAKMIEDNPGKDLFVVPGFIASDSEGRTRTLGRGGSDYTASLFAAGSKARALETWKDVPGLMTANPKIVPEALPVHHISYRAAQELSHFGAKVIYPPTIQPVVAERIPIYVKCTFDPSAEGTVIEQNPPRGKNKLIGISNSDKIALLSLEGSGMVDVPGFSSRLFQTLSDNNISIILITQASSVNTMCVAVSEKDAPKAKEASDLAFAYEISLGKINPLKVETGYSIVCLIGDDMFNQRGTTGRMLNALGRRSIGVRAVAQGSSERNISVILDSSEVNNAIRCIHSEFFEVSKYEEINIFLAGFGTVGRALVDILSRKRDEIAERTGKRIHLAGLSNSRKFIIDKEGIPFDKAEELLRDGESAADDAFFEKISTLTLQNSIFVDCTASSDIAYKYGSLISCGFGIVACNKIPFAGSYSQYQGLHAYSKEHHTLFRYETTVGAALPILETVQRCVNSGDTIHRIETVLSGSMNFMLNSYDGTKPFADVVRLAMEKGYTEPDPTLDLCGKDVLRKLLILAREALIPLEEEDIIQENLLPQSLFSKKGDELFSELLEMEDYIAGKILPHKKEGRSVRFVATLDRNEDGTYRASISFKAVDCSSPLYNLPSTTNTAVITTDLYPIPLVVQGAGAGPLQTASGLLNDILL